MSNYTDNRIKILDEQSLKVREFLELEKLPLTQENVNCYYMKNGKTFNVSSNGRKKMFEHLKK